MAPPEAPALPDSTPPPEAPPSEASPEVDALPGPVAAESEDRDVEDVEGERDGKQEKKKTKKKRDPGHVVVPKARVVTRAELRRFEQAEFETFDLSVPSARLGVEYHAPFKWLSAEVEVDVAGQPEMKDAFGQVKTDHFYARAGQFKIPISQIFSTSVWNLPTADRGIIHDVLTDWLDVGGRRPGFMTGYRHKYEGNVRFGVYGGAFEGSVQTMLVAGDRDTELLLDQDLLARRQISDSPLLPSLLGRVEVAFSDVELGAFYEHRTGSPAQYEVDHYFTAGGDAFGEFLLGSGALRFFADLVAGESWYLDAGREPDAEPTFLSGRLMAGYRFGGLEEEALYVEPYASLGLFDPDLEVTSDLLRETAIGVNAGLWKRARLTLEGQSVAAGRNFPLGTSGFFGGRDPDGMAVLLQAGVSY